jgi:hypothetical protein
MSLPDEIINKFSGRKIKRGAAKYEELVNQKRWLTPYGEFTAEGQDEYNRLKSVSPKEKIPTKASPKGISNKSSLKGKAAPSGRGRSSKPKISAEDIGNKSILEYVPYKTIPLSPPRSIPSQIRSEPTQVGRSLPQSLSELKPTYKPSPKREQKTEQKIFFPTRTSQSLKQIMEKYSSPKDVKEIPLTLFELPVIFEGVKPIQKKSVGEGILNPDSLLSRVDIKIPYIPDTYPELNKEDFSLDKIQEWLLEPETRDQFIPIDVNFSIYEKDKKSDIFPDKNPITFAIGSQFINFVEDQVKPFLEEYISEKNENQKNMLLSNVEGILNGKVYPQDEDIYRWISYIFPQVDIDSKTSLYREVISENIGHDVRDDISFNSSTFSDQKIANYFKRPVVRFDVELDRKTSPITLSIREHIYIPSRVTTSDDITLAYLKSYTDEIISYLYFPSYSEYIYLKL